MTVENVDNSSQGSSGAGVSDQAGGKDIEVAFQVVESALQQKGFIPGAITNRHGLTSPNTTKKAFNRRGSFHSQDTSHVRRMRAATIDDDDQKHFSEGRRKGRKGMIDVWWLDDSGGKRGSTCQYSL